VPLLLELPRSARFAEAEIRAQTLLEAYPESDEAQLFRRLAESLKHVEPCRTSPMTEEALERIMAPPKKMPAPGPCPGAFADPRKGPERKGPANPLESRATLPPKNLKEPRVLPGRFLSKSVLSREPLHGCAFAGALNTLTQIQGAVTVAHGPRSCVHIASSTMLSSGLGSLARYGTVIPEQIDPPVLGTDLAEAQFIHGGLDLLSDKLSTVRASHGGPLFVVTTCPAGVIGEDIRAAVAAQSEPGEPPILLVGTDGNIEGDYLQGVINACIEGAAPLIETSCPRAKDSVNIVAEKNIALNADANFAVVERLLSMLGLQVNCRFVRRTTVESLRGYLRAPLNLLAYDDHLGRVLKAFLSERFHVPFAENPFPAGFHQTERWLREIAGHFHCLGRAEQALARLRDEYERGLAEIGDSLRGKRLMVVAYNHNIDWILETAFDVGMEIVKVGIVDYSQDGLYRTRYGDLVQADVGYNPDQRAQDIAELRPHLVLGNYQSPGLPQTTHYDTVALCPDVGHLGGLLPARRWARLLQTPLSEGWRADEARLPAGTPRNRSGDS
jgi:nitrogenase molybdenum-iron protein alpha/beta subunit